MFVAGCHDQVWASASASVSGLDGAKSLTAGAVVPLVQGLAWQVTRVTLTQSVRRGRIEQPPQP